MCRSRGGFRVGGRIVIVIDPVGDPGLAPQRRRVHDDERVLGLEMRALGAGIVARRSSSIMPADRDRGNASSEASG